MSTHDDDFWGDEATWSPKPARTNGLHQRGPGADGAASDGFDSEAATLDADDDGLGADRFGVDRTGPIEMVRAGWNRLMNSGSNATREHGIVRPSVLPAEIDIDASPETTSWHENQDTAWDGSMFDDLDDDLNDDLAGGVGGTRVQAVFSTTDVDQDRVGIDPTVARFGAVAVIATLLLPLAFGFGSDDGDDDAVHTAVGSPVVPVVPGVIVPGGDVDPTSTMPAGTSTPDPLVSPPASNTVGVTDVADQTVVESSAPVATAGASVDSTSTHEVGTVAPLESSPVAPLDAAAETDAATSASRLNTCAIDYDVVAGDFWIRIADGAGVDLAELLEANGATTATPLFPGASICLPAGSTIPAPPTTAPAPTSTDAPVVTTAPTTPPTTQATTTTTVPAATLPPNSNASAVQVKQIIRDVWPDELEERAIEIAYRESRFVPTAKNFCCHGVFQMHWNAHRSWLADLGITNVTDLYDPVANTKAAYALYQRAGGWGPWGF